MAEVAAAAAAVAVARPLVFALNGARVELPEVDPALTLLTFLRTKTVFRGTKRGCGEGGCGACVVFVSRYNNRIKKMEEMTVNSCLTLLCSLDGCAITTTEGLGNQQLGHHAIHKRMSGFHASQCGFCTPGMTMALYGALRNSISKSCENSQEDGSKLQLSAAEAERAIAGNLCRCTGYRPLLDTCKSFSDEVDIDDLGLREFYEENGLPPYDPTRDPIFPQFLIEEYEARESLERENGGVSASPDNGATLNGADRKYETSTVQPRFRFADSESAKDREKVWIDPEGLLDVFEAMKTYQGTAEVKLVVGNTAAGYYKDIRPNVYIDVSKVDELVKLCEKADGIEVGASVTISNFIGFLENLENLKLEGSTNGGIDVANSSTDGTSVPHVLAAHLKKIASNHVRNWGSVGGNLMMARLYNFESDVATILLGVDAHVKIVSLGSEGNIVTETVRLEDFLGKGALENGKLLQSIWIPIDKQPSKDSQVLFKTFRAAPRPLGFALAFVNAAFFARVSENKSGVVTLEEVRLALGAFGTEHAIRARRVEKHLNGKPLTWDVIFEAIRLLKTDVVPKSGTSKAEYRVSVAGSFLFQFLSPLLEKDSDHVSEFNGLLSSGKQRITMTDEYYPVGQPTVKIASDLQASGEAVYVDDIPSPENCLHAAFVYSEKALAKVKNVDVQEALETPGTVAYISAADIPPKGKNIGLKMAISEARLFATDLVECIGHFMGVMVADSYDHAKEAAGKVKVEYDLKSVGPPILSAKDAMEQNSMFPVHFAVAGETKPIGDIAEGFAEGELKLEDVQVSTESQKHFYMETQTTLAIPDEDNCMVVYSSTQTPDNVQRSIAVALGIPYHNVRVITRRVGGGFGGKVFRSSAIAVACALAAYKLRRPVRTSLDRNTDMCVIGGRSPSTSTFSVAFTKEGRITALKAQVLIEAGYEPDFSVFLPGDFTHALKKYNYGALELDFRICKTNTVPKTAMRGPGQVQGSFLAESIIEHVAARLKLDPEIIRERNFHDISSLSKYYGAGAAGSSESYTLPSIWARLKASMNWVDREREVQQFNEKSTWMKRGLAMIPIIYCNMAGSKSAMVSIFADGSIVLETPGVEIGQGLHTKVRQAAAFALSKLFSKGRGVDISRIRIVQMDSISMANSGITSNSTTSEGCCAAVQAACEILVERLTPTFQMLQAGAPDSEVKWDTLISKAMFMTDMKVHHKYTPKQSFYLNYGAAASEVEINLLTGETQILATDLVFDCGKSLNPAVDIGQIEGAFVQGIGFFMTEGVEIDKDGRESADGTWTYKIPTVDTINKRFHVELFNSPALQERVLSSKASGEAPFLLAGSVYCAIRKAVISARKDRKNWVADSKLADQDSVPDDFRLNPPASMTRIKELCGLDNVELYVASMAASNQNIKLDAQSNSV
ncbi:hypothetical protein KC19_9G150900 [Ceratodon purpureus]|uniref:Uncharacterized protein n=2 Tax=Ceratodon purpureus TaxID=3225 RepID=A0A8T0H012_CERPU|nr:hypothetical protein KC19_9G150900 [Ceratodon purpureus]